MTWQEDFGAVGSEKLRNDSDDSEDKLEQVDGQADPVLGNTVYDGVLSDVSHRQRIRQTRLHGGRIVVAWRGNSGVLVEENAHGVEGLELAQAEAQSGILNNLVLVVHHITEIVKVLEGGVGVILAARNFVLPFHHTLVG